MIDPPNIDPFDYDFISFEQFRFDFTDFINATGIKPGSVLLVKKTFTVWLSEPFNIVEFVEKDILTVLDSEVKSDETTLQCLYNGQIVALDTFMFFLNANSMKQFKQVFDHYLEILL